MTENPIFTNEAKAREFLESVRWPDGPFCPHCGAMENITRLEGKSHRPGLHQCNSCREHFTVTVGTVYERSHVPLHKWLYATHLMCASKKGISSKQIERMLDVTYKTAWFMTHRIREGMKPSGGIMGGGGRTVEADETYVGGKEKNRHASKRKGISGSAGKQMIFSLVERGGKVRSMHLPSVNAANLRPILNAQLDAANTKLMTDGEGQYRILAPMFLSHEAVNHGIGEYVRGDVHINTAEGYFSIFKRGIIGTFHHVSEQHLQRYATEFDFRYNHRESRVKVDGKWQKVGFDDAERAHAALKGIGGKRLTYRRINQTTRDSAPSSD